MSDGHQNERTPTIDESVEVLRELLESWDSKPPTVEVPILEGSPSRAVSILSQAEHAVGLTRAVIVLCEAGMNVQAVPLVRLTMECAVTAAWLSVTPGSAESANLEGARQRRKLLFDMERLSTVPSDGSLDSVDEIIDRFAPSDSAEARKFEERCRSLAGGDWLYPYYRLLSGYSHGGTLLMDHYIQEAGVTDAAPLGWVYVADAPFEHAEITTGLQVVLLHLALTAWTSVAVGHPMRTDLAEIAERTGISMEIGRRKSSVAP